MNRKDVIQDFTQGPIFKRLLLFSIPFMLSNALQVLYSMTDMVIVGKFIGSHGISAVTIASQLVFIIMMLGMGFSTGGQVMISQVVGSGDRNRLSPVIGTLFSMVMLLGIAMSLLSVMLVKPVLHLMQTPEQAFDDAAAYLMICGGCSVFIYGYNMATAVLRGVGDSFRPFLFIVISSLLNIVLDLVFVACFKWGVAGAAFATALSQIVAFALSLEYLYRNRAGFGFDFKLRSFVMDRAILKALIKLGIPFAIRFAAINVSMLFVLALINSIGVAASAAFGVAMRLDEFANKISQGVMMAVSTITAQNMGAGKFDRIRRAVWDAWIISGGFFLVFGFLLWFYPEQMFGIFTDDPEVLKLSSRILSLILLHYPALLIMKGTNGFLQGIGDAFFSLIIALLDGFVFRITFSWLLGIWFGWGLTGIVLGYALATYATALPNLFYFLFLPWHKRKKVI